jgi:hypothetical protein
MVRVVAWGQKCEIYVEVGKNFWMKNKIVFDLV